MNSRNCGLGLKKLKTEPTLKFLNRYNICFIFVTVFVPDDENASIFVKGVYRCHHR